MGIVYFTPGLSKEEFIKKYWPDNLYYNLNESDFADFILKKTKLNKIIENIESVNHYYPQQIIENMTTEGFFSAPISATTASELIDKGESTTLRLRGIHRWEPKLIEIMDGLCKDLLNFPIKDIYANLFISTKNTQGTPHFDGHEVFAVQLKGIKSWQLAPCHEIKHPCLGYILNSSSSRVPKRLGLNQIDRLPKAFPNNATKIQMIKGCTLFMPRGYWHYTKTKEFSVHLTISIVTFSLKDSILNYLDSELTKRETMRNIFRAEYYFEKQDSFPNTKKLLGDELDNILNNMSIESLTKANYLGSISSGANTYRVNPTAEFKSSKLTDNVYSLIINTADNRIEIEATRIQVLLFKEIFIHKNTLFSIADLSGFESEFKKVLPFLLKENIIWS